MSTPDVATIAAEMSYRCEKAECEMLDRLVRAAWQRWAAALDHGRGKAINRAWHAYLDAKLARERAEPGLDAAFRAYQDAVVARSVGGCGADAKAPPGG